MWDATHADLDATAERQFTLSIRTDAIIPKTAAAVIHAAMGLE